MPPTDPATPARAIAGALTRHALTAAGSALAAHGGIDQASVTGAVPALADEAVGLALVGAGAGRDGAGLALT